MEDILVIIDGNSLVNRAFFAIQRPMITSSGFYTQGIYGFLSMLRKIETDYAPTHMLVAFDRKAPTFRHKEYSEYKAGRKGMPEELAMEMPVLKDVLHARGIRTYEIDGFEADDIIGTTAAMAEEAGMRSYIITGDRDALQLATDLTSVVITKKGISEFKLYDDAAMIEEYGFDHLQFIDYKGLRGDTSDNIPGIPGVGEKTAIKLIQQFGSIENMIKNSDQIESEKLREKIEENAMAAMMSKRLATIVKSVPVDYTLEELKKRPVEREKLIELYKTLEFNVFLKQLLSEAPADAGAAAGEAVKAAADFGRAEVLGGAAEAAALLKRAAATGSIVIDVESDDDHIGIPAAKSLCFELEGRYYAAAPREGLTEALVEALSGSKAGLRGFGLGKLYFLLLRNGADISGLKTEFDCALADYVISPTAKADSLEVLLLREFGYAKKGAEASAQQDMFSAPADEIDPADAASVLGLLKELETRQRERVEKN
ncbi:MAG: DNA polymerase I, partial [Firmicutes bacterium]|nr:DNA polymerase I [Bacillota bacterium]